MSLVSFSGWMDGWMDVLFPDRNLNSSPLSSLYNFSLPVFRLAQARVFEEG